MTDEEQAALDTVVGQRITGWEQAAHRGGWEDDEPLQIHLENGTTLRVFAMSGQSTGVLMASVRDTRPGDNLR